MSDVPWTAEQVAAITSLQPTLLEANAGTGKTTTVVGAILWRLGFDLGKDEDGKPLPPCPEDRILTLDRIAAITFTEKAAYDLKRKLRDEIQARRPVLLWEIDRAAIGTIHSFCADLLREHALRFGIDPTFVVADEREALLEQEDLAKAMVMEALERGDAGVEALVERYRLMNQTHTKGAVGYVLDTLRDLRWHGDRWAPGDRHDRTLLGTLAAAWDAKDDGPLDLCDTLLRLGRDLQTRWASRLAEENTLDFDALILTLRDSLTRPAMAPALEAVRRRFGLFVIDEFQDTDGAQRDIAFEIAGLGAIPGVGPQLFLVGDPKQSIYHFRGADISVWNEVAGVIGKRGNPLALQRNFRSAPAVVEYVNRACAPVFEETGRAVERTGLGSRVGYAELKQGRAATPLAAVEWLAASGKAEERRTREAEMVAARIREIVVDEAKGDPEGIEIIDPDTRQPRLCRYRDVAILFRTRAPVNYLTDALDGYGVPYYLAGDAGLKDRLEVLDVLTLLRVLENPLDDLRVFAFLRSPFVGLRDEVIARVRLAAPNRPLRHAARAFLDGADWSPAAHALLGAVEREALGNGLAVVDELSRLPSRVPIHRLVEEALERTGYRLHLLLLPQAESRLANLQRFVGILEDYRHETVGTFLEIWERWDAQDMGIPQAPLYSKDDDVVTLSTIHAAKGLEWPVVFIVDAEGSFSDRHGGRLWSDHELGPVLCPKQEERGPRTSKLADRAGVEERAEEARLMYVATTRARDRLILAGPTAKPRGAAEWLSRGRDQSVAVIAKVPEVVRPAPPPTPELAWLDRLRQGDVAEPLVRPVRRGVMRYTRSATELMTHAASRREWRLKYLHGVIPQWIFARESTGTGVPAATRGVVIHGVLERIREEGELGDLLDVVIGALESPELEEQLAPGTEYRLALEAELGRVVASPEWRWYVEGDHWRELGFVHFRRPNKWRIGAFDLYRPGAPKDLIVDFKTHDIGAEAVERVARDYALQVAVYRSAARAAGREADVRLHFTKPNVVLGEV